MVENKRQQGREKNRKHDNFSRIGPKFNKLIDSDGKKVGEMRQKERTE